VGKLKVGNDDVKWAWRKIWQFGESFPWKIFRGRPLLTRFLNDRWTGGSWKTSFLFNRYI